MVVENADNNNIPQEKFKVDGLLRTVNGIHPKGNNIRMADSPKFAKFKKKKQIIEIPRRSQSGSTTPNCISPNKGKNEELKRREAQLIEALALTSSKNEAASLGENNSKIDISKAKNNLKDTTVKRKTIEPIASRLMPVVSKRQRTMDLKKDQSPGKSLDPRLVKDGYCETSNTNYLMNTNLDQISGSTVISAIDDTSIDNVGIVDMTIDHEALTGTIITPTKPIDPRTQVHNAGVDVETVTLSETTIVEEKNTMIEQLEELSQRPQLQLTIDEIKIEPVDIDEISVAENTVICQKSSNVIKPSNEVNSVINQTIIPESIFKSKPPRSIQLVKPHTMKPPKNYRQTNTTRHSTSSDSDSDNAFETIRRRKRSPLYRRRASRSNSRARSRSPVERHPPSSPIPRSQLYDSKRSGEGWRSKHGSRASSKHNSDEENIDIGNKLSELSNPVPYDIEHERKLQFLVGKNVERYVSFVFSAILLKI